MQLLNPAFKVRMQEAKLAKEKMHGRMACGRPLVVRLVSEKYPLEGQVNSLKNSGEGSTSSVPAGYSGQINRCARIAAIKNKLKAMEQEGDKCSKKQKQTDISGH
ncbi:hypothetical protein F511_15972 [Dorcoceras hygrometricum]|uniref:Uncharacterized protein n=1 Tax=Dorcoceras hygrometricum TaxID=472368 RepID=A0A2Z7BW42_9LAMI|nr:hypothetical protein F511_15972 [Dorcoceras hygrometricum]